MPFKCSFFLSSYVIKLAVAHSPTDDEARRKWKRLELELECKLVTISVNLCFKKSVASVYYQCRCQCPLVSRWFTALKKKKKKIEIDLLPLNDFFMLWAFLQHVLSNPKEKKIKIKDFVLKCHWFYVTFLFVSILVMKSFLKLYFTQWPDT